MAVRRITPRLLATMCVGALALGAVHYRAQGAQPDAQASYLDTASGENWPGFGRTYGEQHYSPLDQINPGTIDRMGLAWSLDLESGPSTTAPVEVDGVLYFANRHSMVHAVDVATGKELWQFDPHAPEAAGHRLRQSWGSRGIAWWNGKVYTGTVDGRLIAIDAKTGKPVWSVVTVPDDGVRFITGAPRVFDGKIIIGHGGADSGPVRGYVTAYDAETGKQLWRFYTVPGRPGVDTDETTRLAAASWAGDWWKFGGGGTVWNAMTYDRDTDTIFLGTGNGYPWNYRIRSKGKGDNLFLCSIVALDAKTGRYKWHYQIVPGETWDFNAAMDIELADLKIDGKLRKVLMTAPKDGFFYIIDRVTGQLLSADPFAKVTWAQRIDMATGRPVENPEARFPGGSVATVWPGDEGAHSWLPMAFSPRTGLVYLPTVQMANAWDDRGVDIEHWKPAPNNVGDVGENVEYYPANVGPEHGTSFLQAWDPVARRRLWQVSTAGPFGGGVVATAGGLVFEGTLDGRFHAFDAATGKELWSFDAGAPVLAPPITYSVKGRQYVTVITGVGNSIGLFGKLMPGHIDYRTQARRVLTFAIGGTATIPAYQRGSFVAADDPAYRPDPAAASKGMDKFELYCAVCHGFKVAAGGSAPDLRASPIPLDRDAFRAVVRGGALVANGMPQFDELDDAALDTMRQYIRMRAHEAASH